MNQEIILRKAIRKIINEWADRYAGTDHNGIVTWQANSDYDVDIYPAGDGWSVNIKNDNDTISKSFKDEEEANQWARQHVEKLNRINYSNNL